MNCNRKRRDRHCASESNEELKALTSRAHVQHLLHSDATSSVLLGRAAEQVKRVRRAPMLDPIHHRFSLARVCVCSNALSTWPQRGQADSTITITRLSEQLAASQVESFALENTQRNQPDDLLSADHQHHHKQLWVELRASWLRWRPVWPADYRSRARAHRKPFQVWASALGCNKRLARAVSLFIMQILLQSGAFSLAGWLLLYTNTERERERLSICYYRLVARRTLAKVEIIENFTLH